MSRNLSRHFQFCACITLVFLLGVCLSSCGIFQTRHKWGFIDKTGKLVIPFKFDDVGSDNYGGFEDPNLYCSLPKPFRNFSQGLCAVRIGDKWGYIDKTGTVVIPAQYDSAGVFSEGLACVRKGKKVGYIDKSGKVKIPIELEWMVKLPDGSPPEPELDFDKSMIQKLQFCDGLAIAYLGDGCGYINKKGEFIIKPNYTNCYPFFGGMAVAIRHDEVVYLNKNGKVVVKLPHGTRWFGDGLFVRTVGEGKYAFVDKTGKQVFPQEFADAHQFSEGLAAVAPNEVPMHDQNSGWGYIDTTGKMVIKPSYFISGNNTASSFVDGRAIVSQLHYDFMGNGQNEHGVIDKAGNWIVPPKYKHIGAYRDGLAEAYRDNTAVFLDRNGKEAIQTGTFWANCFSDGLAAVMQR